MFYNQKFLFFIIQLIFCIFLVILINQQTFLTGFLDNFFVELIIVYALIFLIAKLFSTILSLIYLLFSKLIKHKTNRDFISWLFFTIICYVLTFIAFAFSIIY